MTSVTCAVLSCPDPCRASDVLREGYDVESACQREQADAFIRAACTALRAIRDLPRLSHRGGRARVIAGDALDGIAPTTSRKLGGSDG